MPSLRLLEARPFRSGIVLLGYYYRRPLLLTGFVLVFTVQQIRGDCFALLDHLDAVGHDRAAANGDRARTAGAATHPVAGRSL